MSPQLGTSRTGTDLTGHHPAHRQGGPVDFGVVLGKAFASEPPVGHGVAAVYRRADRRRRRRLQVVLAIGVVGAVVVAALGYALTTAVVPTSVRREAAAGFAVPAANVDPVLTILRATAGRNLRILPREPSRGAGWRQYTVLSRGTGAPRGLIEVSVYTAPDGICLPAPPSRACARPERAGQVEYARYGTARDVDWQVYQATARRLSDGRVLAVMTTGERGTGDAVAGRPPLTPLQTVTLAMNARLISAFSPRESCGGPDSACPLLIVPIRQRTR